MRPIDIIQEGYAKGLEIIRAKNHDYAGTNDFFRNFKTSELVGVNVSRAILVRIMDKISRVSNLIDKPGQVNDEKVEDTILDAINYLAILRAYMITNNFKGHLYATTTKLNPPELSHSTKPLSDELPNL